ncbi:hypothetical protein CAOG_06340 [Capsaspora owczarzaki ATCC 30864]|uniref:Endosomal/lysosomal proton channel TMEM175 n=1 Tax=Capsaspora owczarzaki (strain ATCC 30864) TaxID=595528 RepID=A0A0D2VWJ9_CAPO3|nr:hypothetical protein CAOG_06340 [Capsaspora owczarzaki ATCC 30864]KJE95957.1 hypothetical protein CAOG_006340 [Capsaspora owczarzaki ATCC 30864]|eukprot:XP_004345089.1 hypothetical protein CAOG_06340 [Capsaspora owczarzaki ATCC 30864]
MTDPFPPYIRPGSDSPGLFEPDTSTSTPTTPTTAASRRLDEVFVRRSESSSSLRSAMMSHPQHQHQQHQQAASSSSASSPRSGSLKQVSVSDSVVEIRPSGTSNTNSNSSSNTNSNSNSGSKPLLPVDGNSQTSLVKRLSKAKLHDVYMTSRLEAYSDSIFGVAATLMVLPLQVTKPLPDDTDLEHFLYSMLPQFLIYLSSFTIIANMWASHVRLFRLIKHVDDIVTWINLFVLLFTSFIPFSCTLLGRYSSSTIAVVIASLNLLIVGGSQLLMVRYVSSRPHLLSFLARKAFNSSPRGVWIQCLPLLVIPTLCSLALISAFISVYAGWAFLILLLMTPAINYSGNRYIRRRYNTVLLLVNDSPFRDGALDLARLQGFADGVFSLAATLLVLTVEVPSTQDTDNAGLVGVLENLWPSYLSFVGSFMLVAILWHVHHVIHFNVERCTTLMVVFNNISLAFVGFIPFCSSLITDFATTASFGEIIVVQLAAGTIFIAAMFQAGIWVYVLLRPRTAHTKMRILSEEAELSVDIRFYVSLKVVIIPLICSIAFLGSFASYTIGYIGLQMAFFVTPVLFLLSRMSAAGEVADHYYDEQFDDRSDNESDEELSDDEDFEVINRSRALPRLLETVLSVSARPSSPSRSRSRPATPVQVSSTPLIPTNRFSNSTTGTSANSPVVGESAR